MAVENEHERSPGSDVSCGKTLFTTHLAGHLSCAASRATSGQPSPVRHAGSVRLVGLVGPVRPVRPQTAPCRAAPAEMAREAAPPFRTYGHARLVTHVWSRMSVWVSKGTCHGSRTAGQALQVHSVLPSPFPAPGPLRQASTKRYEHALALTAGGLPRRAPRHRFFVLQLSRRLAALPTRTHAPAYQDTRAASSRTRRYTEWVEAATASQANLESASSRPRCEMKLRKPGSASTRLIPQASESALPE